MGMTIRKRRRGVRLSEELGEALDKFMGKLDKLLNKLDKFLNKLDKLLNKLNKFLNKRLEEFRKNLPPFWKNSNRPFPCQRRKLVFILRARIRVPTDSGRFFFWNVDRCR